MSISLVTRGSLAKKIYFLRKPNSCRISKRYTFPWYNSVHDSIRWCKGIISTVIMMLLLSFAPSNVERNSTLLPKKCIYSNLIWCFCYHHSTTATDDVTLPLQDILLQLLIMPSFQWKTPHTKIDYFFLRSPKYSTVHDDNQSVPRPKASSETKPVTTNQTKTILYYCHYYFVVWIVVLLPSSSWLVVRLMIFALS